MEKKDRRKFLKTASLAVAASILTFIRTHFGNEATTVDGPEVTAIRAHSPN